MHDAKTAPNDEGPPEQGFDLLWRRIGGDIKILGRQAHEQIAHCAAHDVCRIAPLLQSLDHLHRTLVDLRGINAMHAGRNDHSLTQGGLVGSVTASEQLIDEFFDHGEGNNSKMGQPRCCATARKRASGLVATGWLTFSSRGKSLMESL